MIKAVRDVTVLTWIHGIPRPLAYSYISPPPRVAVDAIARGDAAALGRGDDVTAECERWGHWDSSKGGGAIAWRCRVA